MINKISEKIILKNINPKFLRHFWEIKIHEESFGNAICTAFHKNLIFFGDQRIKTMQNI
jgi:hypothetical protein